LIEDVTYHVKLDSAALSRTEIRKMGYGSLARIGKGEAKGVTDITINMIEVIRKRPQEPGHHSDPEFSPGRK